MKAVAFKAWLQANYAPNAANTQLAQARKVEQFYGDLDQIIDSDELEAVIAKLNYSSQDAKAGKPNPSKLVIGGNLYTNLASYKSSLRCYGRFRNTEAEFDSEVAIEVAGKAISQKLEGKQFELERNLQTELRI